jgi:phenylpropionate dioxygenase-like ring-hydroxylating dioxygenase large terminal subunit
MDRDEAGRALQSVPLRVADPELIPARRYYDSGFFELEKHKLWSRVWQMACRLEEIPDVGDYVEYRLFEKTIVVVRTANGIKAYHNVCRHRGMRLVEGRGNCRSRGFICPFHGWRYDMEGGNTFVFGRKIFSDRLLEAAEIGLKACRVETWGGCAFINFDDDAPPLTDALGPVTQKLEARGVDQLRTEWWYASVVPTNWKVSVEAFLEMYHLMRTHPEFHARTPSAFAALDSDGIFQTRDVTAREAVQEAIGYLSNLSEGMGGLVHHSEIAVIEGLRDMEVPDDPLAATMAFYARAREEIRADSLSRGISLHDLNEVEEKFPSLANELLFPNFFLLPMFGCMASYRIRPLTEETCLFEIWSLIRVPEGEPYTSPREPTMLPHDSPDYPLIVRQDYANMPNQQIGLRSGEIEYQRVAKVHEGIISNFERLIDGYLAGLDSGLLQHATHIVNGGSFGPLQDIGF